MFSSNATQVSAVTQAEAVDFDGTNDYLSRSTVLSGAANSKTFTLSFWFWAPALSADCTFYEEDTGSSYRFVVQWVVSSTSFRVFARNTSGTNVLVANYVLEPAALTNTFYNILVSVDLASTSNRYFYVNDQAVSPSWTTYTNQDIGFANSTRYVVSNNLIEAQYAKTRLSNFYRDNTYRNLSITANRRLFITADLKPAAGQAALSPILYLPMSDPTTVGTNAGTGGNFTLTGTIARSGRGPNQYNAPYSDLDGSADYLQRISAPTGIADGKTFTLHCAVLPDVLSSSAHYVLSFSSSSDIKFRFYLSSNGAATLNGYTSAGTNVLTISFPSATFVVGRNYVIDVSVDLTDTAKRHVYVNGTSVSVTWSTYIQTSNINFAITTTPKYVVGTDSTYTADYNGKLGALWFNTSYIDLSVAANLAKFVTGTGIDAKPVDLGATGELPTGTSPLIYLPMYGNNAGNNYGTGGNFTAVSDPYTGARGPNEFWGNKAKFVNSYVGRSSSFNWSSTNKFTCSFWINNITNASGQQNIFYLGDSGSAYFSARLDASNRVEFWAADSSGTMILSVRSNTAIATGSSAYVQACFDLSSTAKRFIYINGANSLTSTTYTNTSTPSFNFARIGDNAFANYQLSEVYLLPDYIDFSVEANRLKFYDAFGNPTDLPSAITALSVTNPPIYMRFPPTAFGTNSGTGGAFTVTGTITDGGQL